MDVRLPDGTIVKNVPEGTTQQELMARVEASKDPNAKYKKMQTFKKINVTDDMNFLETTLAGAGKAFVDIGRGIRQLTSSNAPTLTGLVTGDTRSPIQREIDDAKELDKDLMGTWGGNIGNIGTQVGLALAPGGVLTAAGRALPVAGAAGRYLLASPATMGGVLTQGLLGAAQAGLQPVATGEDRGRNMIIGGAAGALVPAAGLAWRTGKAALDPLYRGGQERIVGRAIANAAGDQAPAVQQALQNATELVPGSLPTAGQAANNAGVAALERTASAIDPSVTNAYAQRMAAQNEARVTALRSMAGSAGARTAAETARDTTANALYGAARNAGIDEGAAKALKPQVKNLMERMPSGVLERAKELARLNGEVLDNAGSVNGLHWIKQGVDDMLSSANQSGMGKQTQRALMQFKDDLLTVVDDLSPQYGTARQTFARMSTPINQMDVAEEIAKKSIRPLDDTIKPGSFASALADEGLPARATGFKGATFDNTMTPRQMATLGAIRSDLARANFAQNAGRGVGSDTIQKLAYSNLVDAAGVPTWVRNIGPAQALGGVAARGADTIYSRANREIARLLAEGLLSPQEAARLMAAAQPSARAQAITEGLLHLSPAAIGTTTGLLNLQQQ